MGNETKRPATYEDLLALPEHVVGQLIDGELIVMPRPANRHGVVFSSLLTVVNSASGEGQGGAGGWWIIGEPERWVEQGRYSGEERVRVEPFEVWVLEPGALWLSRRKAP